jgi:hypothetical protein
MLNLIPTPRVVINELFREPMEYNCLQNVIHMFTLHICPMATQKSYQHYDKIYTWTSKEISSNDVVSFVIKKKIISSSIPRWRDINKGENNALEK